MDNGKTLSVKFVSNDCSGIIQELKVASCTTLAVFLEQNKVTSLENKLARVDRRAVPNDYILEEGDCILVIPTGIRGEQEIKVKNEIWVVHPNDPDYHPSEPHAHNKISGLKLDLSNGDLYDHRRKVRRLKTKTLRRIRKKINGIDLPDLTV